MCEQKYPAWYYVEEDKPTQQRQLDLEWKMFIDNLNRSLGDYKNVTT
jgi:hypothetical protein